MEEAITATLLGDTAVAARVSTRVNWLLRPQDTDVLPAITLQRLSGVREYDMDGPCNLVSSRLQLDAWGETYGDAKLTARDAISALSGFSGTVSGTELQGVFVDGERDFRADDAGAVRRLFRTSVDFIIWHKE